MTIKRQLSDWTTAAISIVTGAVGINAFGNIKELKAPLKPKIPKTLADYKAMHAAEMKRRHKAETRLRNQRT